jgi:hypothetical protein
MLRNTTALLTFIDWSCTRKSVRPAEPTRDPAAQSAAPVANATPATEQQATKAAVSEPGMLFWTDGRARSMPFIHRAAAMATLAIFLSWIYVIGFSLLFTPISIVAATLAAGMWVTVMLPCQVRSLPGQAYCLKPARCCNLVYAVAGGSLHLHCTILCCAFARCTCIPRATGFRILSAAGW